MSVGGAPDAGAAVADRWRNSVVQRTCRHERAAGRSDGHNDSRQQGRAMRRESSAPVPDTVPSSKRVKLAIGRSRRYLPVHLKRKSGFDNPAYHPSVVRFQRWIAPGWPPDCISRPGRPARTALPPTPAASSAAAHRSSTLASNDAVTTRSPTPRRPGSCAIALFASVGCANRSISV